MVCSIVLLVNWNKKDNSKKKQYMYVFLDKKIFFLK
jgi:hypothetical protein